MLWFESLAEAEQLIEAWRQEYNGSCSHRALENLTPSEFASQYAASSELTATYTRRRLTFRLVQKDWAPL